MQPYNEVRNNYGGRSVSAGRTFDEVIKDNYKKNQIHFNYERIEALFDPPIVFPPKGPTIRFVNLPKLEPMEPQR